MPRHHTIGTPSPSLFHVLRCVLTLFSLGFFGSSQPGGGGGGWGGGHKVPPHHNFFVIGHIMMKLGKLVKCLKLYLMIGFWCTNWL